MSDGEPSPIHARILDSLRSEWLDQEKVHARILDSIRSGLHIKN